MNSVKPPRLKRGDVIGIIAPASAPNPPEKIEKGACYFEKLGYRVKLGKNVKAVHGHLAGTDAQRVSDLNDMLNDRQVKAIFAVRGGYGTPRLLPFIDYSAIRKQPKIMVGYSDMTGLQLAIFKKTRLVTFSGPMPGVEFWNNPDPYTEENFWPLITSSKICPMPQLPNLPLKMRRPGKADGILLGGNLSLIVSSLGTPFIPSFRRALLTLEEVGEEPYRADRMLTHLRNAGIFQAMSGLLLGHFTDCVPSDPKKPHLTLDQVMAESLEWVKQPAVSELQYGHISQKLTIPLGVRARLDADNAKLELLEAAVE